MEYDLVFIAGAPGVGKSTVAKIVQKELGTPLFEFGWIPEFRKKAVKEIPYEEEEGIAFENLSLVLNNYLRHGFKGIIVTDLEDKRIQKLHEYFPEASYALITLYVDDQNVLKKRVMDETRPSGYRDWKKAIELNQSASGRNLLPNETRINTMKKSADDVAREILKLVKI